MKILIAEMRSSVTDDRSGRTKPTKNVRLNKLDNDFVIVGFGSHGLYPLGNIIHCYKNVLASERRWEGSHEVYTSDIKNFHYQNGVERHHVPHGHCSEALTSITRPTKLIGVLKQGWPEDSTLYDLCRSLFSTEVSSTSQSVAKGEDALKFALGNATADDLISTVLEKLRILPQVRSDFLEEFVLLLPGPIRGNLTYG